MLTMVNISASRDAWGYLLDSVSSEQSPDRIIEGRAAYYMENGTPPGTWFGAGLSGINIGEGSEVEGGTLNDLFGKGIHPLTGDPLGKKYHVADPDSGDTARTSVAGFELVFSPPKSVSAWWALADPALKDQIRQAHSDALQATLRRIEKDVARTRVGTGGIAQAEVRGISAAMFDHWDSREGDPQLHTHVLISNRVQGIDGRWRTLDSRGALTPAIGTMGNYYDTILMDMLSQRFGVEWTVQEVEDHPKKYRQWLYDTQTADSPSARANFALDHGANLKNLRWQIDGVGKELREEYSTRAKKIRMKKDQLIISFSKQHGREPTTDEIIRMRQAATIRTRTSKSIASLQALTQSWRKRSTAIVGDSFLFADRIVRRGKVVLESRNLWSFRADDVDHHTTTEIVEATLSALALERSTWSRWNAETTVSRLTAAWRFRSVEDREAAITRLTDEVLQAAVPLTPKNPLHTPRRFQTADGESQFHPRMRELYTTLDVWHAEERLLEASRNITDLGIDHETIHHTILTPTGEERRTLSPDQTDAVTQILASGRLVDVLIGPAGAGKTTSLQKLKEIWESQYGVGSVRGLAPTARAAEVLAESLDISTENTAKWLHETRRGTTERDGFNYELRAGDLIIVDEASIAGTLALDELRAQAVAAGAKLLLVGDWAQLAAVDAGGAFGLIANDMGDAPELINLHRFSAVWEGTASKLLRLGRTSGLTAYIENDRVRSGTADDVLAQAVDAWKHDESTPTKSGDDTLTSLLIAPTNEVANELNTLAREWRVNQGLVDDTTEVTLAHGVASPGDKIVTRQNDRTLKTDHDRWVKNNDEWEVRAVLDGGAILAASGDETVLLPAHYVAEHVQLAYATTAHRSQGRTVDTAHAIVDDSSSRENFYVAMTRGKHGNHAYVITADPNEDTEQLSPGVAPRTWEDILERVVLNRSGDQSAHEIQEDELERMSSIRQLAAEYQTIHAGVLEDRYLPLLESLDLVDHETLESPYLGPLLANLNRLDHAGENTRDLVAQILNSRGMNDARNPLAVLHFRIGDYLDTHPEIAPQERIAGLIPSAIGTLDPDTTKALDERAAAMQLRAEFLVDQAIADEAAWITDLGEMIPGHEHEWRARAVAVACYRDLYSVTGDDALGTAFGHSQNRNEDRTHISPYLARAQSIDGNSPRELAPNTQGQRTMIR